jgi:hypothetical protein
VLAVAGGTIPGSNFALPAAERGQDGVVESEEDTEGGGADEGGWGGTDEKPLTRKQP